MPLILAAASVGVADTRGLLAARPAALEGRRATVLIKLHAARDDASDRPPEDVARCAGGVAAACQARALYDCTAAADVLVTGGSMLAFEAMALGVTPIVFENPGSFAAASFEKFEAGCFIARNRR